MLFEIASIKEGDKKVMKEKAKETVYILFPGEVVSFDDGDRHYIGAGQLMLLYNVNPRRDKYVIIHMWKDEDLFKLKLLESNPNLRCVSLFPRGDGKYYDVHEKEKEGK